MGVSSSTDSTMLTSPNTFKKNPQPETEPIEVTCDMETCTTTYRVKLNHYSKIKLLPKDFRIDCGVLNLAGHRWAVSYKHLVTHSGHSHEAALCIKLLSETTSSVYQNVQFSLIEPNMVPRQIIEENAVYHMKNDEIGIPFVILDSSKYIKNDCLSFECTVQVAKWSPTVVPEHNMQLEIPCSNFQEDLGHLLENGKGADVSFEVCNDGFSEIIVAHTIILTARSPVFRALLSNSPTDGNNRECIRIDDIEAAVFKAILYYIYTDKLPHDLELTSEIARQLFVAADRYKLERVKLICAQKLCNVLDFETATSTLVLAEQYGCEPLKNACLNFVSSTHKNVKRY